MADQKKINYASLHRAELLAAIETAPVGELKAIDSDLEREGWDANGAARQKIAARLNPSPE